MTPVRHDSCWRRIRAGHSRSTSVTFALRSTLPLIMKLTNTLLFLILACLLAIVAILYRDRQDNVGLSEKLLSGEITQRALENALAKVQSVPIQLPVVTATTDAEPKLTFVIEKDGTVQVSNQTIEAKDVAQFLKDKAIQADDAVRIDICATDEARNHALPILDAIRKFGISRLVISQKD